MQLTTITSQLEHIEQLYTLREPPEVISFLAKHPYLPALLLEAYPNIQRHFPDAPAFLEVFSDPESAGHRELFLAIGTTLDADAAYEGIQRFNQDWWLKQARRSNGFLTISVEFI